MATSAPFSAAAREIARPNRFAAPVTSIVLPERRVACIVIRKFYAVLPGIPRVGKPPPKLLHSPHDAASGSCCLFPQGMSSLRDSQREHRQAPQARRLHLA